MVTILNSWLVYTLRSGSAALNLSTNSSKVWHIRMRWAEYINFKLNCTFCPKSFIMSQIFAPIFFPPILPLIYEISRILPHVKNSQLMKNCLKWGGLKKKLPQNVFIVTIFLLENKMCVVSGKIWKKKETEEEIKFGGKIMQSSLKFIFQKKKKRRN